MSLINGLEYGMAWWIYTITANLRNWRYSIKVELATVCLGPLYHRRGCMNKSSVASILPCLVSRCHRQNLGSMETSYHAWGPAATKVVRPRSDPGSRCINRHRSDETRGSSTNSFLSTKIFDNCSLRLFFLVWESGFARLQWQTPNDELATVHCLDIEACGRRHTGS